MFWKNFQQLLRSYRFWIGMMVWSILILLPSFYFLDIELVKGNLGLRFLYTEITLSIIIAILFGSFFWGILHKIQCMNAGQTTTGIFAGFLWILVSGCPSCSITLAAYFGLAGIISALPYSGLELKILSVFILLYANYTLIRDLQVCKISRISQFFRKRKLSK